MTINKNDYLIFSIIAVFYLAVVLNFKTNPVFVIISSIVFALLYVVWGVFHHYRSQNLHLKIVLEYCLVALLGVVIISTLLL